MNWIHSSNVRRGTCVVLVVLVATAGLQGKVIHVDDDAAGADDGTSWEDSYKFLQDALADADSSEKPIEIRVAQGVYTPDSNSTVPDGTGNREATFQLMSGVSLIGGYAGSGAADPNARDIELYETIFSGDLAGDDGPNFADNDENSYHVVSHVVYGPNDAILDGFTITGGNANGGSSNGWGGGLYNVKSNLSIANCIFSKNFAAAIGGGVCNDASSTLTNCIFAGNYAGQRGGGMEQMGYSTLTNCIFIENSCGSRGGGVSIFETGTSYFIGCIFTKNVAYSGGAIHSWHGSSWFINCTFNSNLAERGGVVYNTYRGYPDFMNCAFVGNTANYRGGVIFNNYHEVEVVNCTFIGNSAETGRAVAGEYEGYTTEVQIVNSIIWDGGDEIWTEDERSKVTVTYSDIEGGYTGDGNINEDPCFVDTDGPDNILGTEDDNLHLRAGSPCIDAGDNDSVPLDSLDLDGDYNELERIPVDFDWALRFLDEGSVPDTGNGTPPIIDMGIYEYGTGVCGDEQHPYPEGDVNRDCRVDFKDFAIVALHWCEDNNP